MSRNETIVVAGLGEVGKPLFELLSGSYKTVGVDIAPPPEDVRDIAVLHVCYPFQIRDFVGETVRYIRRFSPKVTVVNSTVEVGTTRAIAEASGTAVVYSPVRGKHAKMLADMKKYVKFIGAIDPAAGEEAARHFQGAGLKTKVLSAPEAAEIAKLTETTFFGLMIAWAQEVERYADRLNLSYDEIVSFYEEIGFFPPVKYTPGVIGGHCVMPNIELLGRFVDSDILKAIKKSNVMKTQREAEVCAETTK